VRGPRGTRTVWLVTGIAVGFGAGFVVFDRPRAPERAERRAAPEREASAAPDETGAGGQPEPAPLEKAPTGPKRASTELVADVDAARAAGDWQAFTKALGMLGAAGDAAAQRKLVEIMGDGSIDLTEFPGVRFHKWLKDSTIPGIAAAARARYEANVAAGETSWVAAAGWVDLVAEHGTREDLEWVVALIEKRLHQQSDMACRALLGARNPAVVEFVQGLWKSTGRIPLGFEEFATNHTAAAFGIVDAELAQGRTDEHVVRAYALCVREGTLGVAKARLLDLREPGARLAAVYAVERMSKLGLDVSGLEPILAAPVEILTRGDGSLVSTALYAIEYNERVMWTQPVLDALRGLNLGGNERHRQEVIRLIESRLKSSWKGR
jgi:hypothetical protein